MINCHGVRNQLGVYRMATLAFALALAQATGSLTCRDEQVVSYSPEQIAAATAQAHRADPTGCENA